MATSPPNPTRPRVAVLVPNQMSARTVMESPILELLAARQDLDLTLLIPPSVEGGEGLAGLDAGRLGWANIDRPVASTNGFRPGPGLRGRQLLYQLFRPLWQSRAGAGNLVFRFNHLHQFAGHRIKIHLPPERKGQEARAGNYADESLGRPWPDSLLLFRLLYRLHFSTWDGSAHVEAFFEQHRPDLVVFLHLQTGRLTPYSIAARRRGIPILGMAQSWDQPTTKGPLQPGITRYAVQSRRMAEELAEFHDVDRDKIAVLGWPMMDLYKKPGLIAKRRDFLESIGLPPEARLLLFGANSARLGDHEPNIARHLAARIGQNFFGPQCTLLVRPHPKDDDWASRFVGLHNPPRVIVQPAEKGRLEYLANLIKHAHAVLASSGTICLDAAALDTCSISIGFDGGLPVSHYESVRRYYEMDHYRSVVASGGTRLVENFEELDQAVREYLDNPDLDQEGREQLRQEQLEPFDGRASKRLVGLIAEEAFLSVAKRSQGL